MYKCSYQFKCAFQIVEVAESRVPQWLSLPHFQVSFELVFGLGHVELVGSEEPQEDPGGRFILGAVEVEAVVTAERGYIYFENSAVFAQNALL